MTSTGPDESKLQQVEDEIVQAREDLAGIDTEHAKGRTFADAEDQEAAENDGDVVQAPPG